MKLKLLIKRIDYTVHQFVHGAVYLAGGHNVMHDLTVVQYFGAIIHIQMDVLIQFLNLKR